MSLSKLAELKLKAAQAVASPNKLLEAVTKKDEETIQTPGTALVSVFGSDSSGNSESSGIGNGNSITTSIEVNEFVVSSTSSSYLTNISDGSVSFDHLEFLTKMGELEAALLSAHPTMPVLLREIHNHLKADPEIVTLLTEDAIGIIVNGLKVQTKTELSGSTAKSLEKKGKKVALSLDMF